MMLGRTDMINESVVLVYFTFVFVNVPYIRAFVYESSL